MNPGLRTCLLGAAEWRALQRAAHGVDVDQVLGVGGETGQGEVVPGGRQPLVLGPAAARHLVAEPVAGDFALRGVPVDGEGGGEDLGEAQADRGVQSWKRVTRSKNRLHKGPFSSTAT